MIRRIKVFYKIIITLIMSLILSSCALKDSMPLNQVVIDILAENDIKKSKITQLGDFKNAEQIYNSQENLTVEITDEELQKFVDDLLLIHEEMKEATDQYILDYYGFDNEDDFIEDCKMRLIQQKRYENKKQLDKKFLNELAKECNFSIDKEELAKYSQKIVEQHKDLAYINGLELDEYIEQELQMTKDEFYDYCYNSGEEEIKRYLLVGAYCNKYAELSQDKQFIKFCSMMGYDSSVKNNDAEYAYLERECVNNISQTGLYVYTVGYSIPLNSKKEYTVELYDSSNIYSINYAQKQQAISKQNQQEIILHFQNLMFGETTYNYGNNLYDTVIAFKSDGENTIKVMIDSKNGFVSMKHYGSENGYPYIVETELTRELEDLISKVKQG